jgi:hypothetical protein
VIVPKLFVEDHAGDVLLVQPLHDYHDCRLLRVIKTAWDGFEESFDLCTTLRLGGRRIDAMWIVDDHAVTTDTSQRCDGGCDAEALRLVDEVQLLVLIFGQLHAVAPPLLIPW